MMTSPGRGRPPPATNSILLSHLQLLKTTNDPSSRQSPHAGWLLAACPLSRWQVASLLSRIAEERFPCEGPSTLAREGAYGQALDKEVYPDSAGSAPSMHNDQVIDLTAMRPSSAPSDLGRSSQVCISPHLIAPVLLLTIMTGRLHLVLFHDKATFPASACV